MTHINIRRIVSLHVIKRVTNKIVWYFWEQQSCQLQGGRHIEEITKTPTINAGILTFTNWKYLHRHVCRAISLEINEFLMKTKTKRRRHTTKTTIPIDDVGGLV